MPALVLLTYNTTYTAGSALDNPLPSKPIANVETVIAALTRGRKAPITKCREECRVRRKSRARPVAGLEVARLRISSSKGAAAQNVDNEREQRPVFDLSLVA